LRANGKTSLRQGTIADRAAQAIDFSEADGSANRPYHEFHN
jgi:hypothetical protein